ncbi:MAG: enoyl-CoA hydratase family protein [Elsteraceae bacterium]
MAEHFLLEIADKVATITINRPERKNPLTFESYAELRDTFRSFGGRKDIQAIHLTGAGGNFCSGGDVREIIGPLTEMKMPELLAFTQMTGDLIKAMRGCPQPIVAAIDGICVGAGACMSMAADIRLGTARSKVGFLFTRVGLAGCDMGACSILPRIIGHGRASELLYTGRLFGGEEALANGYYARLCAEDKLQEEARALAVSIANGPSFAHRVTKRMLHQEWAMSVDDAIDAEAQAQAICMDTGDFRRAYEAFINKQTPIFEGN